MSHIFYRIANTVLAADETEAARYLGYSRSSPPDTGITAILRACTEEMRTVLTPQAVYDTFDIIRSADNELEFAGMKITTVDLSRNLNGCSRVAIFAATIGVQADILIRRAQRTDSAKAAIMQATGAMFIESFVNTLNMDIRKKAEAAGGTTRPRYSPGYGDVPLSVQQHIFSVLPCTRIGLSLMDTLVMSPEKSVTAFIGIVNQKKQSFNLPYKSQ